MTSASLLFYALVVPSNDRSHVHTASGCSARRSEYHLFKQLTTGQYGRFAIRSIAPGDYRLFSWEQVERGAWEDPSSSRTSKAKAKASPSKKATAKLSN